ncbi:hypothetical protein [Cellulomonas telluris]|uniref:hypothetical protein n=1 Tax=Cellulomonas telluris TaxID=2306636 RepID=UPI0010A8E422|nr:hypothetical protein [Cellulomonas telluris]
MSTDEDFATRLRARADAVAPPVPVDLSGVVGRGRRRRVARHGAVAALAVVALAGAGLGASTQLGLVEPSVLQPALPEPPQLPWDDEPPASAPTPSTAPTVQPDGTVVGGVGDPWTGDEPYWYTVYEATQRDLTTGTTESFRREQWTSRERPGLTVTDGDLATASGFGPRVVMGRYRIDGEWVDMLDDPNRLPTDPAALEAVLRDSVEPDRRQGTPDDKVVEMATELVLEGGLLPVELRHAAWQVAAAVPGAVVTEGTDSTGRPGQVLRWDRSEWEPVTYVRDPSTGLMLEVVDEMGWHAVYLEQRPSGPPPVAPTLENSGCAQWVTC